MVLPLPNPAALPGAERELVLEARAGRPEARERLARQHRPAAYLLALQLLGDADDALDAAQEAMLRFFAHLDRLDPERPVRPWLLRIVRNQVKDLWRRRRIRRTEALDTTVPSVARHLVDHGSDPEEDARRRQLRRRVWRGIARLSDPHREILVLRDFHDLDYSEIAGILGIPRGTVMSRLHAARKRLREALEQEAHERSPGEKNE